MKKTRMAKTRSSLLLLAGISSGSAFALTAMTTDELGGVTGQDGLNFDITSPGITMSEVNITYDSGTAAEGIVQAQGVSLNKVNDSGTVVGGTAKGFISLDASGNHNGGPGLRLFAKIGTETSTDERLRLRIENLTRVHTGDTLPADGRNLTRTFGTVVLDAEGYMDYRNKGLFSADGFFDSTGKYNAVTNRAYLKAELQDAKLYYRQLWHAHPYLILNNLNALWEMQQGTIGLLTSVHDDYDRNGVYTADNRGGLIQAAPFIKAKLEYDLQYKFPVHYAGEQEFTITGNEKPMLHFAWQGTFKDAQLIWRPGGGWLGTSLTGTPQYYDQSAKSEGLTLSARWNYVTNADDNATTNPLVEEFRWRFGEATGNRVRFELSDWKNWRGATVNPLGFDFPLVAFDTIRTGQGPGGLCWGGPLNGPTGGGACSDSWEQFVHVGPGSITTDYDANATLTTASADARGYALYFRRANLMSYSNKVRLLENPDGSTNRSFNWGLIYTLANLDASFYLYPGGNPSHPYTSPFPDGDDGPRHSPTAGIIADINLMSQTFAKDDPATAGVDESQQQGFNWDRGSHFMIADTDPNGDNNQDDAMGIGLVSSSFLVLANDTRIWIKPNWNASDSYEGGLDLYSPETRIHVKGTFGGGELNTTTPKLVRGAGININFEGMLNLRLSPSASGTSLLGYSAAARMMDTDIANFSESTSATLGSDDGTFISLAEPGRPTVDMRFANITGDLAIINGDINLKATGEEGVGSKPKLIISQDLLFGSSAAARITDAVTGTTLPGGAAAGQAVTIGRVEFGNKSLGSIVIPSGRMYTSISLMPKN